MCSIIYKARLTIAGSSSPIGGASKPHPAIPIFRNVAATRPVSPIGEAGRFTVDHLGRPANFPSLAAAPKVMSIYDRRGKPAYENFAAKRSYSENPHILKWWTPAHDQLMTEQIEREQWLWYWGITDEIVATTPPETIQAWQQTDPLCSKYAWYNVLMYFAASRAEVLGLTKQIREPKWKACPLCNERFVEDSLPGPLVQRLETWPKSSCS